MKPKKNDGSSIDLTFQWIGTSLGTDWLIWRDLAEYWVKSRFLDTSPSIALQAIKKFLKGYLYNQAPYAYELNQFFSGQNGHLCSEKEFYSFLTRSITPIESYKYVNHIRCFVDFIIENLFTQIDNNGDSVAIVKNPIGQIPCPKVMNVETVRTPLPYSYIVMLREILCPLPSKQELDDTSSSLADKEKLLPGYFYRNFIDWKWAQTQSADWFTVKQSVIDKKDFDCVWRKKQTSEGTRYEMWCPVRAMIFFVKLHLPLRTYQIRFLDSGEADTWRYENGDWKLNQNHSFVLGTKKRPFCKGVFRRTTDSLLDSYSTSLYINTNKTMDNNKEELQRGYVIPWEHEEALYWLEKLRNWQEKYNPIKNPTNCVDLEPRHTGNVRTFEHLQSMGSISFLFRYAAASKVEDKDKPVVSSTFCKPWHSLLLELEDKLAKKGIKLNNGERLKLVCANDGSSTKTFFPLHSLRVSLITAYTMDTDLPLPIISKLLAGHTRLMMTIYYNKITPSIMREKMKEAEENLGVNAKQAALNFLQDASMEQIDSKMVYRDFDSISGALANRNPIGWESRATGLCLVGGNVHKHEDISTIGGCWNGGELLKDAILQKNRIYAAVPNGPENCVRCRWFITEAHYLPALNAQFNQLSYKAHHAANLSIEIEEELDSLKDECFFCEEQDEPFTKFEELKDLQHRFEKQKSAADEYTKDWIACFGLINKIILIEEKRNKKDKKDKFIAVGEESDVRHALKFVETQSELLQLSLLCEDAEFYPSLGDELRKTPAINRRTIELSRILMKKGLKPIFLEMDEKQQFITANAMFRQMAKIADPNDKLEGYRKVANYIEAETYLVDSKLFDVGLSELQHNVLRLENRKGSN